MNILLKIILIILATLLCVIFFGVLVPFLYSLGLFPDLGGDGNKANQALNNVINLYFSGVLLGLIVGLVLSTYIVLKKPSRIKRLFISLSVLVVSIISIVFVSVNFLGL